MRKVKFKALLACFMALLMLINTAPIYVMADTEPEIWYTKNDVTIDKHILFGENKMYTDGKSNRGFDCLVDNNTGSIFYVSTADSAVNYANLSENGKEIMVTVHMSQPVVIDHFKIVAGADTFKANYAHRNPAGWNLKAGNSADSCNTVLVANKKVDASEGYKPNVYSFDNTTAYQYYQFTITALAGAGRNGHDGPFSNPTATCTLADIAFGGPEPITHTDHDDITFTKWNSTNSLPTAAGNYFLDKDVTISSTWNVPSGTTNLCLNGHGIKKTGNGRAITVNGGANLNIYDCGNTTHYFDVTDHLATNINDTSGAQSFTGGYITGGNANGGDTENQRGGGIFVYSGGNFTMNGGTLIGNKSTNIGAAICSSPLNVSNNTSVITLNAGSKIMYNATPTNAAGGIYASGNVNLNGVQITNNYAGSNQIGGVNFNGKGTVTVSGATVVKDNYSGDKESNFGIEKTLQLGELTDGAYISMYSTSSYYGVNDGGAFTTENGKVYIDCFHVDSSRSDTYILGTTADGAIKMGKKFTVTWNDSDNSNLKTDELFKNDIPSYEGDSPEKLQDEFYTYTFAGWHDGTNTYGINDTLPSVTENITYTALYTQTSVHNHNDATFEAWTKTDSLPTSAGNYVLANDITISSTWNVPSGTTNLCLNGHGITKTGTSGSVIRINSGSTLKLHDCGTAEHYYYIGAASTYNSSCLGALVSSTSDSNYVNAQRRGSFKGGYITGGYGTNYSNPGSTVFGGGVFVDGGSFVMNGGCIFGNRLSVRDGGNGGGGVAVRKSSSSFVMNGGYIIGNHAGRFGGGIRIDGGSFTMNGGEIRHNTANTPNSGGAGCGGGLHLGGLDGGPTVSITGGIIEGNYAGLKDGRGGGINVAGGTLTVTGGKVIGNNATLSGGGINGAFTLSGNAVVADNTVGGTFVADSYKLNGGTLNNVNLSGGQTITLGGALTDGASIGIRLDDSKGVFTSGWSSKMQGKDPTEYFTSDNKSFDVFLGSNNEAEIGDSPAASIINGETTTKYPSFSDALSNWSAGSTLKLLKDATTNSTITVSGTKTLDLNGHGIRRTGTGSVIKVNEQSTLNLKDSDTSKEHKYKTSSPAGNGAGFATVDDTLTSGYKTFKGGYITGGYITGGYNYGAGINVEGNGATLNMYGGTIIGNRLTAGSTGGGGVCLQDWDKSGGFNMYGGSIIGNTSNYGGGVYVRCGKMVMHDGEISNNVAHSNNIGGAVLAFGGSSTFIMEGGTINGNLAQHGGAIEASGDACVSIFGGTITNNTANGKGGALTNQRSDGDTSPAVFNISGAPVFSGNTAGGKSSDVYLCNTAVLNVTDEMTNTTPILVSRSNGSGTFTSGWKDKMGEADPAAYFTAEVSNYQVRRIRNGEAYVGLPHTHNWSYTANGDTISATCSGYESGVCLLDIQTVEVCAEDKDYDGTAVTATLTKSDDWKTENGLSDPTISYSGNTDAGTYTASITLAAATASTEFTINEISMADEVSAENYTGDYDGEEHTISVTKPSAATVKYGTESGTYNLSEAPTFTDAGTHTVYYQVTRKNYITITDSATVTINRINAVVTITGHTTTVDYNGNAHSADGYDAETDSELYDVEKDFVYNGRPQAVRTDAGTTYMNLDSAKFENTNPNFETVEFNITDGYVEINKIDAVITKEPQRKSKLVYTGSKQALIKAGTAEGGTLYYAIGNDDKAAPSDKQFKTELPEAKSVGSYYIWYKVKADSNHYSLEPVCVKVTLADKDWVTVSGTVIQDDGSTQSGADVTLMSGNKTVDTITSDENGDYYFTVPAGVYNIVTSYGGKSQTTKVELYEDKEQNIDMIGTKTESIVHIKADNDLGVVVDGLNEEAEAIRKADKLSDSQSLSLVMTVEAKTADTAKNANKFKGLSKNTTFEYFDISLEKTVDSKKTVINSSQTVLEIAVPYEKMNRKDIAAYYCDGNEVKKLTESKSKEAGTYWIDKENKMIYIYSNEFATFAIGYTPYYLVDSSVALGSFKGKATIVMKGKNGEGTYTLKDVSPDKLSFDNIPKGEYEMTVTWVDGVENTLTVDVTVA